MSTPPTSASNVQIRAPLVAYRISLGCGETRTIAVQELLWWVRLRQVGPNLVLYRAPFFLLEFMDVKEPISTMEVVIADVWGPEWLQPSLMACLGFVMWTTCGNTVPKRLTLRHKWMVARDHAISKWLIFQLFDSNFRFDFLLGVPPCPCPLTICDPKAYCQCIGRSRPNQPIWRGVPVFIRYRQGVCLGVKIYDLLSPKRFKVVQGLKKPIPGSYTICFLPWRNLHPPKPHDLSILETQMVGAFVM